MRVAATRGQLPTVVVCCVFLLVQDGRKAAHLAKIVTQTHGIHRVRLESAPSALDVGVRVFDFGHDGEATR